MVLLVTMLNGCALLSPPKHEVSIECSSLPSYTPTRIGEIIQALSELPEDDPIRDLIGDYLNIRETCKSNF